MGTIIRYSEVDYKINKNDHNPPHVHAVGRGGVALIDLRSLDVLEVDGFSKRDMRDFLEIVKIYHDVLMYE